MTKCNECIHKLVCKFTEEYQEAEKKFLEDKEEKFYKTDLKCKYFEAHVNYWPKEINLCKIEKHSPCDDCWYHKMLEDGGTYVGDSPCQWCQHSPTRVTCNSEITSTSSEKVKINNIEKVKTNKKDDLPYFYEEQ